MSTQTSSSRLLWLHWLLVVFWAALIFFLSSRPASSFPLLPPGFDKVVHAVEFGVLSVLLYRALTLGGPNLRPAVALRVSFIAAVLYGVSDEIHQAYEATGTRDPSAADVLADAAGAYVAALIYHRWWTRQPEVTTVRQDQA